MRPATLRNAGGRSCACCVGEATDACAGTAPDVDGAMLGRTISDGLIVIAHPLDEIEDAGAPPSECNENPPGSDHPRSGRAMRPAGDLPGRCEQLGEADRERSGPRIERLRKHCGQFGS